MALSGFLMVLSLFLLSNPLFGLERVWPWEHFNQPNDWRSTLVAALYAALGVWALVMAFAKAPRTRSTVALALLLPLLILMFYRSANGQPTSLLPLLSRNLATVILFICLGGGFMLARHPSGRRAGSTLALLAGLGYVANLLFTPGGTSADSILELLRSELSKSWEAGLFSTDDRVPMQSYRDFTFSALLPGACVLLASVWGMLSPFFGRFRWPLWLGLGLLVCAVAVPQIYSALYPPSTAREASWSSVFVGHLANVLVNDGLAPMLLGMFAIADWGRFGGSES